MLANFLFRVRQYLYDNRVRLIRLLLFVISALIVVALIFIGVSRWKQGQYEKRVQALEKQFNAADAKAKAAEARARGFEYEIEARKVELRDLEIRAEAADLALKTAQGKTKILKEAYETIRYVPIPADTPVSVASACAELAELKYFCK